MSTASATVTPSDPSSATAPVAVVRPQDVPDIIREQVIREHRFNMFDNLDEIYRCRFVKTGEVAELGRIAPHMTYTGQWTYLTPKDEKPYHLILIGDKIHHLVHTPTDDNIAAAARLVYRHECAHATYTDRDLEFLAHEAGKHGLTFRHLNAPEDWRIECRDRAKRGQDLGYRGIMNSPERDMSDPDTWLTPIIFQEDITRGCAELATKGLTPDQIALVAEFAERFRDAATTADLIPLILEYRSRTGRAPVEQPGAGGPPETGAPQPGADSTDDAANGSASSAPSQPTSDPTGPADTGADDGAAAPTPASPATSSKTGADGADQAPSAGAARAPGPADDATGADSGADGAAGDGGKDGDDGGGAGGAPGSTGDAAGTSGAGDTGAADVTESPADTSASRPLSTKPITAPGSPSADVADPASSDSTSPGAPANPTAVSAPTDPASAGTDPSAAHPAPCVADVDAAPTPGGTDDDAGDVLATSDTGARAMHMPKATPSDDGSGKALTGPGEDQIGDLELAQRLSGKDCAEFLRAIEAASEDLLAPPEDPRTAAESARQERDADGSVGSHTIVRYSSRLPVVTDDFETDHLDKGRIEHCATRIGRAFRGHEEAWSSQRPSRRLDMRHEAIDRDDVFRHFDVGRQRGAAPFTLIVDCSGSMAQAFDGTTAMREGRHLIGIVNRLAEKGFIQGHVVLSQIDDGMRHRFQSFRLPVPMQIVGRIPANGEGEGLQPTLEHISELIEDAVVCVYTDANITDRRIDKDAMHRRGIYTYGMYCGPRDRASNLETYFDQPMIAPNVENLSEQLAQTLMSQAGRVGQLSRRALAKGRLVSA